MLKKRRPSSSHIEAEVNAAYGMVRVLCPLPMESTHYGRTVFNVGTYRQIHVGFLCGLDDGGSGTRERSIANVPLMFNIVRALNSRPFPHLTMFHKNRRN
jgi:hypothetical protein